MTKQQKKQRCLHVQLNARYTLYLMGTLQNKMWDIPDTYDESELGL